MMSTGALAAIYQSPKIGSETQMKGFIHAPGGVFLPENLVFWTRHSHLEGSLLLYIYFFLRTIVETDTVTMLRLEKYGRVDFLLGR